jgi:hypothetical protein
MVSDVDEWLHPVDGDAAGWVDSMTFAALDHASGALVWTRIDVAADGAAATWITWIDGVAHVERASTDSVPPHNWDVMEVAPVGCRMEQARRRWSLHLAAPSGRGFLVFESADECLELGPQRYGQAGAVSGDLFVAGRRIAFEGPAARDHTWGSLASAAPWVGVLGEPSSFPDGEPSGEAAGTAVTVERFGTRSTVVPLLLPAGLAVVERDG